MTLHSLYCDQFAISTLLIEPDDQDSIGKELVDYIYSLLFSNWSCIIQSQCLLYIEKAF